jgi:DNA-binding GntR family transcriptional regulator
VDDARPGVHGAVSIEGDGGGLGPAARRVLADEVADALRDAIMTGRFEPGQRLIEHELATQLAVSRGPVREALSRLSQEGLVVVDRHRGASVVTLSGDEADQIYSLRTVLEELAVAWLCRLATSEDFDQIEAVLARFDELPRPLTRQAVAALDVEFHDAIFLASHHDRAYRAWAGLRSQLYLYLVQLGALDSDFTTSWQDRHRKLLRILRTRKPTAAVKAIGAHTTGIYEFEGAAGPGSEGQGSEGQGSEG